MYTYLATNVCWLYFNNLFFSFLFQFKDLVFDELNTVLTKIINDELGKCAIQDIIAGNCDFKHY